MALRSRKSDEFKERDYSRLLPAVNFANETLPDTQTLNRTVQIAALLQTTLEATKLIELFAAEIKHSVAYDSLSYLSPKHDMDMTHGERARHSCNYRLVAAGEVLGELVFTRKKRFTHHETATLENLICGLVYPLRNALLYAEAVRAAFIDPLTGMNNRATMDPTLQREIEMARRHNTPLSLIILDIDHFKVVNDTHGHAMGDRVIKALADCLVDCIRCTDILFRYGGEEFTILLSNTSPEGALLLAERIRRMVEKIECFDTDVCVRTTVSLGVAYLCPGDDAAHLFEKADGALYCAKYEGRNCVRLAVPRDIAAA